MKNNEVELFLSSYRDSVGEYASKVIAEDWAKVGPLLGGTARLEDKDGRPRIADSLRPGPLDQPEVRERAFRWLAERTNAFVNVLRPRVRPAENHSARAKRASADARDSAAQRSPARR